MVLSLATPCVGRRCALDSSVHDLLLEAGRMMPAAAHALRSAPHRTWIASVNTTWNCSNARTAPKMYREGRNTISSAFSMVAMMFQTGKLVFLRLNMTEETKQASRGATSSNKNRTSHLCSWRSRAQHG